MKKATLVLLPGLDGTGVMFEPLLAVLGAEWDVKVVSYPRDSSMRYPDLVSLVRESLPDRDFYLLGESFSGPIALKIAAEQPRGLRGVILCATFVRNPTPLLPACLRFLVVAPLFCAWPVSLRFGFLTPAGNADELRVLVKKARQAVSNRVLAARTRDALGVNVEQEFRACAYPMLYLSGARDLVVPESNLRAMLRLRPDLQSRCLDTSHLVLQENPSESATLIGRFMESHLARDQVSD